MLRFVVEDYGQFAVAEAWDEFQLWKGEESWEESEQRAVFFPWMLHRWAPDECDTQVPDKRLWGVSPTQAYLDRKAKRLDPVTRRYLGSCLAAPRALVGSNGGPLPASDTHEELSKLPEVQAKLREMLAEHYDNWISDKLPALGGRTPLEAVKDVDGKAMVEALVTQIERDGPRMMPPLDEAIPRRLRERLGLSVQPRA